MSRKSWPVAHSSPKGISVISQKLQKSPFYLLTHKRLLHILRRRKVLIDGDIFVNRKKGGSCLENLHTGHRFVPLDPTSEILLAWERDGFPQTAWSAFSFKGPCDVAALQTALQNKLSLRPVFQSHLAARPTFLQTYQWRIADDPCPLEVTDLRDTEKRPDDMEQWIEQRLAPTLKRNWRDLATAYPVRFILLLLPENYGFFVIVWHHAAIDGGGLYDFLRDLFSEYHRLVKGGSDRATVAGLHAQAGEHRGGSTAALGKFFQGSHHPDD